MTSLRDAFAPFLAEVNNCACSHCRAVDTEVYVTGCATHLIRDPVAHRAAISEQLRVLTTGEHQRLEWEDYVRSLPDYDPNQLPGRPEQVSISHGMWIGFGSGLHDRPHPPWVAQTVAQVDAEHEASYAPTGPVQLDLFEVAA